MVYYTNSSTIPITSDINNTTTAATMLDGIKTYPVRRVADFIKLITL